MYILSSKFLYSSSSLDRKHSKSVFNSYSFSNLDDLRLSRFGYTKILRLFSSSSICQNQQVQMSSSPSNFNSEFGKYWLGGFVEGEGTVCASIKLDNNPKLKTPKIRVDLEFLVTQHYNGIHILNSFLVLFDNKGYVKKKSGSDVVWEYRLKGIDNLLTYVVPFYTSYVLPFSGKLPEYSVFYQILLLQKEKAHLTKDGLIQIVKLAYTLNDEGKGSKRKRSISEVISIIEAQFDTPN